ncbi:MAG: family 10 glycosylhydrolase, partial [Elainellaceae cyanobacterium]
LHFNTVYPSVWNWGYTLFPSPVAEQAIGAAVDPHPALQGRDVLAEAVEEGHRLGLSVIPWFEFGLMVPSYSELARRHPDWVSAREDGSTVVMQGRHPRRWLNPLRPQVQDFLVELIADVVTRYDVDGIQLDDHFGMPIELGYDAYTVTQYKADHGGDEPPSDRQDPEWLEWRSQQVTTLMERIVQRVRAIKPDCIISLSPNPSDFAYENYAQDWNTWLENGWLDELIVQVYRTDLSSFTSVLNDSTLQSQRQQTSTSIGILTGLKNRPMPASQIQEQVETARDRQYAGVSFFFYESLGDRNELYQSLFPNIAPRP